MNVTRLAARLPAVLALALPAHRALARLAATAGKRPEIDTINTGVLP